MAVTLVEAAARGSSRLAAVILLMTAVVVGNAFAAGGLQKDESPAYLYEYPPPLAYKYESPPPPFEYYKIPPPAEKSPSPYVHESPPPYEHVSHRPPHKYESPHPPAYKYESPPPPHHEYKYPPPYRHELPPPYKHELPPPHKYESPPRPPYHAPLSVVVNGAVYCDLCHDGKMKKPLQGVEVGVFCWNGEHEDSFYGKTNEKGRFKIELSGFDYEKWGGKACGAKLIAASYETPCTIPTELHGGDNIAKLRIKSKSEKEVVLLAGPFAYKSEEKSEKCWTPVYKPPPYKYESPPHKYESPPPYKYESPPYKYESPPPPYKI